MAQTHVDLHSARSVKGHFARNRTRPNEACRPARQTSPNLLATPSTIACCRHRFETRKVARWSDEKTRRQGAGRPTAASCGGRRLRLRRAPFSGDLTTKPWFALIPRGTPSKRPQSPSPNQFQSNTDRKTEPKKLEAEGRNSPGSWSYRSAPGRVRHPQRARGVRRGGVLGGSLSRRVRKKRA